MCERYDLIPSQQNIYMVVKFSFHKQIVQIPSSFAVDRDIDFDLLNKALNVEIERNDSLRLRFEKSGDTIKQYFIDEYKIDSVPVLSFRTKKEQDDFFAKDAQKPVRFLKDEIFRIYFYNSYNGYKGIYFNCSHLAVDAMGIMVFFYDLLNVYRALAGKGEMPEPLFSYEEYVKKELERMQNKERLAKGEAFYKQYFAKGGEPIYVGVHGPEFLEKARKKQHNPNLRVPGAYLPKYDKAKVLQLDIEPELSAKIFEFCKSNNVAPESLFMFAMRTHCSAINYREPDVFLNVMCSKRITYKEQRTGGCMAQTLQLRTILSEEQTFDDCLKEFFDTRTKLYRYVNYPFTYARFMLMKMYNHKATQGVASFMFSWLPVPITEMKDMNVDFRTYNLGRYFNPLYAICYPDPATGGITMHYMYRCKIVTPKDVESLHRNMVNIIKQGMENSDITLKELLDSVKR